jgi:hypothetical protein
MSLHLRRSAKEGPTGNPLEGRKGNPVLRAGMEIRKG